MNAPMTRFQKLLDGIDTQTLRGLEIGALCNPVVDRSSPGISYMDHLDTAGLRAKYAADVNVRVDDIVDVRYVHQGGPLADTVGGARFDYVVASHVAEHVPDLIGWLQQLAVVLQPGGVVSLAVPDKRFCFDCLRRNSDIVDLVEAYLDRHQRPSFRQVLDHHYYTSEAGVGDWLARLSADPSLASQVPRTLPHLLSSLGIEGLTRYHQALRNGDYIDVHCWVWTDASFIELLREMAVLDVLPFTVRSFYPTQNGELEFFVILQKLPEAVAASPDREARKRLIHESLPVLAGA